MCDAGPPSQAVRRVFAYRSPLPRRAVTRRCFAAAVPIVKIMVNQWFKLKLPGASAPGRKRRQVLVPGNIFPVGKQSLTIRDLASRRGSTCAQRDMRSRDARMGQGTNGKGQEGGSRDGSARSGRRRRRSRAEEGLPLEEAHHHGGGRRCWCSAAAAAAPGSSSSSKKHARGKAGAGRRKAAGVRRHAGSAGQSVERRQRARAISQGQDRARGRRPEDRRARSSR